MVNDAPRETELRDEQPLNALVPISTRVEDETNDVRRIQPLNADDSIFVIESGKKTPTKLLRNASASLV